MTQSIILAGGMGAVLNCALANYFSSFTEYVVQQFFVQPVSALMTVLPAVVGFLWGTLVLLIWHLLKAWVVRFLLDYNGWFLHPKRPVNKLWYLFLISFFGRKNRGSLFYQDYLPSYPVPPLKATFAKYLKSLRPLQSPEEHSETEACVKEFLRKDGLKLQFLLKLRSWQQRNWISDWWRDYVYLKQRTPIPFNSNYFALGEALPLTSHQLDRAALVTFRYVLYHKRLIESRIEVPMAMNVAPFCMDGHWSLHRSTRIPGKEIDKIVSFREEKTTHIVVYCQGRYFSVDILSRDGRILSPKRIKQQLQKIKDMAGDEFDPRGSSRPSVFTALPRAKWAEIRERMLKYRGNRESLKAIDSCLSIIHLDSEAPGYADTEAQSRVMFHGNGRNRWFDKSVQLAILANGVAGSNVEHTPIDATVAGQSWEFVLSEEVYDEDGHVLDHYEEAYDFAVPPPTELQWELADFEEDLIDAERNLSDMIADSDLCTISCYGKEVPKKCRLSPDGWVQMALQLAYYRMHHKFVLTYESATTRLYYKGRTETIRPLSEKAVEFVKSMDDPSVSKDDVKKLLKAAIEYQSKYKMEAMRGLGIDRHLFGLYVIAKGTNMDPMPRIFEDKAFNVSFDLSTSQTPVKSTDMWRLERSPVLGGFGTVSDKGYGVSYIVVGENTLNLSIHSKRSCQETDSRRFSLEIKRALEDLRTLYGV